MTRTRVKDRRVQRTRKSLHDALFTLIGRRNYGSISVKEILDRADVGRSTFYTHFRDKDDLLESMVREQLRTALKSSAIPNTSRRSERILGFSLPLFEHVYLHRVSGKAMIGPQGQSVLHERLRKTLADLIISDVATGLRKRSIAATVPADLLVQHIASTFVLVLDWWIEQKLPCSPKEVNNLFRALVMPILSEKVG
jgi:AcrR family transcriptional regulator